MSRILLVRHGQASFGAADYDQLSDTGADQSRILGRALARAGVQPDVVVTGRMKRHAQTADGMLDGSGWDAPRSVDEGWNEFDHLQVLAVHTPPASDEAMDEKRTFQRWFEEATLRWTSGNHESDYDESFTTFTQRVEQSLGSLAGELSANQTAVVVTSGGPVAWATASLLGAGTDVWLRLNPVCVNTAVTKVIVGSRGVSLVSFNDHSHLSPDLLTYR